MEDDANKTPKTRTGAEGGGRPPGKTRVGAGEGGSGPPFGRRFSFWSFWSNYKKIVKESFNRMSPTDQKDLVNQLTIIGAVGATVLIILILRCCWFR